MLTLQILDGGETFFRPLDDHSIVLGSDPSCDVRLSEDGVAPRHARVEPLAGANGGGFKIVDLGASEGTVVNGRLVAQVRLELGDRIELGRAVLVVGQRVPRPARPADVAPRPDLVPARPATAPTKVRQKVAPKPVAAPTPSVSRRSERNARRGKNLTPWIAGSATLVVVLIAWLLTSSDDRLSPAIERLIESRIADADVAGARDAVAAQRSRWAGRDRERNAILDAYAARIDEVAGHVERLRTQVLAEAGRLSHAEQDAALREMTVRGDPELAAAAREILVDLYDLRLEAQENPRSGGVPDGLADTRGDAVARALGGSEPIGGVVVPTGEGGVAVGETESDVREALANGDFALARQLVQLALGEATMDDARSLRALADEVAVAARTAREEVLAAARREAAAGTPEAIDRAVATLDEARRRFVDRSLFDALTEELRARLDGSSDAEVASANADARGGDRGAGGDESAFVLFRRARDEAANDDFLAAAATYERLADMVGGEDPEYARDHRARARDLRAIADLVSSFAGAVGDEPVSVTLADGRVLALEPREGKLVFPAADEGSDAPIAHWKDVSVSSLEELVERTSPAATTYVDAAALAYHAGHVEFGEKCLRRAVERGVELDARVSSMIARGRGEVVDERGYSLLDGEFLSVRQVEIRQAVARFEKQIGALLKRGGARAVEERRELLQATLDLGFEARDGVADALVEQHGEIAERISGNAFRRHIEELRAVRRDLDQARAHALDLIYDEKEYFYPYKPPQVSSDDYQRYLQVQKEVDHRVGLVRDIWERSLPVKPVPDKLLEQVRTLDWVEEALATCGRPVPTSSLDVSWSRLLDGAEPIGLQTLSIDEDEVRAREHARRVIAFNESVLDEWDISRAERSSIELTNAYRMMFGRRPLALNKRIQAAARGHAEEMDKLGYFSHYSPTPGLRTPFDRMRQQGYTLGSAENIADVPTAVAAHDGWTHSSGHHRTMLMAGHREFGIGAAGRKFVQNFGGGSEFENDPNWQR
jgi:hypothetical protein